MRRLSLLTPCLSAVLIEGARGERALQPVFQAHPRELNNCRKVLRFHKFRESQCHTLRLLAPPNLEATCRGRVPREVLLSPLLGPLLPAGGLSRVPRARAIEGFELGCNTLRA